MTAGTVVPYPPSEVTLSQHALSVGDPPPGTPRIHKLRAIPGAVLHTILYGAHFSVFPPKYAIYAREKIRFCTLSSGRSQAGSDFGRLE